MANRGHIQMDDLGRQGSRGPFAPRLGRCRWLPALAMPRDLPRRSPGRRPLGHPLRVSRRERSRMRDQIGNAYLARKALFSKGIREGRLGVQEIERMLTPDSLSAPERWLLYYSLRAAEVELVDEETGELDSRFAEPGATARGA